MSLIFIMNGNILKGLDLIVSGMEVELKRSKNVSVGVIFDPQIKSPVILKIPSVGYLHKAELKALIEIFDSSLLISIVYPTNSQEESFKNAQPYVFDELYLLALSKELNKEGEFARILFDAYEKAIRSNLNIESVLRGISHLLDGVFVLYVPKNRGIIVLWCFKSGTSNYKASLVNIDSSEPMIIIGTQEDISFVNKTKASVEDLLNIKEFDLRGFSVRIIDCSAK